MPSVSQSGQIAFTCVRRQDVDVDADRPRHAGVVHVLVPAVLGAREADVGADREADALPGLRLQRLVERHRVFVDLADRVAHVEERQQPGRVPGRAGGQLLALHQHRHPSSPSWRDDRASRRRPRRPRSPPRAPALLIRPLPVRPGRLRFIGRSARRRAPKATRGCPSEAWRGASPARVFGPRVLDDPPCRIHRHRDARPAYRPARLARAPGITVACRKRFRVRPFRRGDRRRRHFRRDARLPAAAQGREGARRRSPAAAARQHGCEHRPPPVRDRHAALRAFEEDRPRQGRARMAAFAEGRRRPPPPGERERIDCGWRDAKTLYLAGDAYGYRALHERSRGAQSRGHPRRVSDRRSSFASASASSAPARS